MPPSRANLLGSPDAAEAQRIFWLSSIAGREAAGLLRGFSNRPELWSACLSMRFGVSANIMPDRIRAQRMRC